MASSARCLGARSSIAPSGAADPQRTEDREVHRGRTLPRLCCREATPSETALSKQARQLRSGSHGFQVRSRQRFKFDPAQGWKLSWKILRTRCAAHIASARASASATGSSPPSRRAAANSAAPSASRSSVSAARTQASSSGGPARPDAARRASAAPISSAPRRASPCRPATRGERVQALGQPRPVAQVARDLQRLVHEPERRARIALGIEPAAGARACAAPRRRGVTSSIRRARARRSRTAARSRARGCPAPAWAIPRFCSDRLSPRASSTERA